MTNLLRREDSGFRRSFLVVGLTVLMMGAGEVRVETPQSTLTVSYDPSKEQVPVIHLDDVLKIEINDVALHKTEHRHRRFEFVVGEGAHSVRITGRGLGALATRFKVDPGAKQTIHISLSPERAIVPFEQELARALQTEWAQHLGTDVAATNSIGMSLRLIPAGEFMMGTTPEGIAEFTRDENNEYWVRYYKSEAPQHRVVIGRPFMLGANEVTRKEFREFIAATGYKTDAERDGKGGYRWEPSWGQSPEVTWENIPGLQQTDVGPVVNVSWNDAVAFCKWLSKVEGRTYRLPTEAEWEYACRAGSAGKWSFAPDDEALLKTHAICAWSGNGSQPQSVGLKLPNAFGLFDMHGNVYEWCNDWYSQDYYQQSPTIDPLGPAKGEYRVMRGGSFGAIPKNLRCAHRNVLEPTGRTPFVGFRVAREIDDTPPVETEK